MTNYDYIMKHVSPREVALAMRPTAVGFGKITIFEKAWHAWSKHCSMMEGYQKNQGNVYSPDKPVNPFSWSSYAIYVDGVREVIEGHSETVSFETWLAKQYNPSEWE